MDAGTVTLTGSQGAEAFYCENLRNIRSLIVNQSAGNDAFAAVSLIGNRVTVNSGEGNDNCQIFGFEVNGVLAVNLGGGVDILGLGDNHVTRLPLLNGGSGDDTFEDHGGNFSDAGEPKLRSFEHAFEAF